VFLWRLGLEVFVEEQLALLFTVSQEMRALFDYFAAVAAPDAGS
jgi:hypothetical protein